MENFNLIVYVNLYFVINKKEKALDIIIFMGIIIKEPRRLFAGVRPRNSTFHFTDLRLFRYNRQLS
ncbi:hypothetical protein FACS1894132_04340 [Clostridia bacterium]|nr:hypothetical protein FACS1894132_04340 [Clostridia bacterium]